MRKRRKKVIITISLLVVIGVVVAFIFGESFAGGSGVDHSSRVVVQSWSLSDEHNNVITSTHGTRWANEHLLEFSWTLTAPGGTTLQGGDFFSLHLPRTNNQGVWVSVDSAWVDIVNAGVVIGEWRIVNYHIEVRFNQNVNNHTNVSGNIRTGRVIRNLFEYAGGGVHPVVFGGVEQQLLFIRRQLTPLIHHTIHYTSRTTNSIINWGTVFRFTNVGNMARREPFTAEQDVRFSQTLTGDFGGIRFDSQVLYPLTESANSLAHQGVPINISALFTRVIPLPGETYEQFSARLQPREWGVHRNAQGVETVVVRIGTADTNGARTIDADPDFIPFITDFVIRQGFYNESHRPMLLNWFERMYGASNPLNGGIPVYGIYVTERFETVSEDTVKTSSMTWSTENTDGTRNVRTDSTSGTLFASTATGNLQPGSARLYLHAEDTNEALSGVEFGLQIQQLDGSFVDYPNWNGGQTNEQGYLTSPRKGIGTYRFIQRGVYSDEFNLSISQGFDYDLDTVISDEFFVAAEDDEGHVVFVTNARRRRCVVFLPGDCGVFDEQINCDVGLNDETPEFDGTPEGENICEFDGWDRIETEDGDVIYTARWNRRNLDNDQVRVPDTLANIPLFVYIIGVVLIVMGTTIIWLNKKKRKA